MDREPGQFGFESTDKGITVFVNGQMLRAMRVGVVGICVLVGMQTFGKMYVAGQQREQAQLELGTTYLSYLEEADAIDRSLARLDLEALFVPEREAWGTDWTLDRHYGHYDVWSRDAWPEDLWADRWDLSYDVGSLGGDIRLLHENDRLSSAW